jgi:hypothetical protein
MGGLALDVASGRRARARRDGRRRPIRQNVPSSLGSAAQQGQATERSKPAEHQGKAGRQWYDARRDRVAGETEIRRLQDHRVVAAIAQSELHREKSQALEVDALPGARHVVASDLMTRAAAPGNAFTFLMAGAATDYTEILVLREVTGRLKAALLLPLLTQPQVLVIGWALNAAG